MVDEHIKTHNFWESIKDYDKEIVSVFSNKHDNLVINEIINIKNKSKKNILDLGCGVGNSFEFIKEFNKIVAVDFSNNMLNIAKKKKKYNNILFYNQNLIELNLNEKFDVILIIMSIFPQNHFEFITIMNNVKKHLKKNGNIYLVVQSIESATLYLQYLSEILYKEGKNSTEIIQIINNESKNRNYHPLGYYNMNQNITQKHWLKEELELKLNRLNFKIMFIKKLELSWTTQFKFSYEIGEKKLWYWFLKIKI